MIAGNVGEPNILAEIRAGNEIAKLPLGIIRTGMILANISPPPSSNIIEPQRGTRSLYLCDLRLGFLALAPLYRFGFTPGRAFGRAEKATTSDLEIVLPERGARVASDGHGGSFRVCTVMNSLRSASANILRWRCLP